MGNIFWVNGRCGRLGYFFIEFLCGFVLQIADYLSRGKTNQIEGLLCLLVILLSMWISICVNAKRCHDLGHNGWWQLIPFYGIIMLFAKGEDNDNKYGPSLN